MNDTLDMLWPRAELRDHVLNAREVARWQADQRVAIISLGLIRRTSDATALICEDCGPPPHTAEVIRDRRKPLQPYYVCPEIGRVPLVHTDLQQWEADFDQIAVLIRKAAGLTGKATTPVTSRIWLLGRQQTGDSYWELFLMRGLCWSDGVQILNQCSRLRQSPAPVVLVPCRLPNAEDSALPFPIRTLSEVVAFAGSNLVIHVASLVIAVGENRVLSGRCGPKDDTKANVPIRRFARSGRGCEAILGTAPGTHVHAVQ